jgi:adenylate kinase family enzyme
MKNKEIKIHILGASGSGVTILGKELAANLQIPFRQKSIEVESSKLDK